MADTKTVLITGCSSGIGRATAYAFLEDDWRVYATARDTADIERLGEAGCDINTLDVTDPDDIERVVDRIVERDGRVDCLVNNAGYGQHGPIEDVPDDLLQRQFDVNLFGPHRLVRGVLPHMREREDGTIVNVSSVAGRLASPGMGAYSASKFAMEGYSDALRNEVAPHGVDVSVIQPGPVKTKFRSPCPRRRSPGSSWRPASPRTRSHATSSAGSRTCWSNSAFSPTDSVTGPSTSSGSSRSGRSVRRDRPEHSTPPPSRADREPLRCHYRASGMP